MSKERLHTDKSENESRNHAIKTLEISRSKYEGKALKSKKNSKQLFKQNNKGEARTGGKLQNKCKVLTNTSSKESMIDINKLTIDEAN